MFVLINSSTASSLEISEKLYLGSGEMVGVTRFLQFLSRTVFDLSLLLHCLSLFFSTFSTESIYHQRDFCEKKLFQFIQNVDQVDDWIIMLSMRHTERTFLCCSKKVKKERKIDIVQILFSIPIF